MNKKDKALPPKSRTLSLLKTLGTTAVYAGGEALRRKLSGSFELASSQSQAALKLVEGLDQLKGIAMKLGQFLSLAEDQEFLPPGWKAALVRLQSQATPKPWEVMHPILNEALPQAREFARIDPVALHAASVGQVHRAWLANGQPVAVKIRYPEIEASVESDLKLMRQALQIAKILPNDHDLDGLLATFKEIFLQELDFTQEKQFYQLYRQHLSGYPNFVVPAVVEAFCSPTILTTEWVEGINIRQWIAQYKTRYEEPEVALLRDRLGANLLELLFCEIFEMKMIQSDPNPGNFLVTPEGKLALLDFGATQSLKPEVVAHYRRLCLAGAERQWGLVEEAALALGFLEASDSLAIRQSFVKMIEVSSDPFYREEYSWQGCHLMKRFHEAALRFGFLTRFRPPPADVVFLNRRIAGNELLLEDLGARLQVRPLLWPYLKAESFT